MDRSISQPLSFFLVGMFVGLLIATGGFSLVVRSYNLRKDEQKTVLKLAHSLDHALRWLCDGHENA